MENGQPVKPKINISKFFRLFFVCIMMCTSAFMIQNYINSEKELNSVYKDLKVAVFLKNNINEKDILKKIKEFDCFKSIEYVDSDSAYEKAVELSPELQEIFTEEDDITYPAYVLASYPEADSTESLSAIKNKLLQFDFVDNIFYDDNLFEYCFSKKLILESYKKIFVCVLSVLVVLFIFKIIIFIVKKFYKEIFAELAGGFLMALLAYMVITLSSSFYLSAVLILDWQILYILLPLGAVSAFLTKEANV